MSYRKLLPVIGATIWRKTLTASPPRCAKTSWLFPGLDNIFSHFWAYKYPVLADDEVTEYTIDSTGTSVKTIVAGGTGINYKIEPDGEVPLLAATSAKAIFGDSTDVTNCMLIMVELPTMDFADVSLTQANGSPAALTEEQVVVGEDVAYLLYPVGLYDSSGITPAYANFTLTYRKQRE